MLAFYETPKDENLSMSQLLSRMSGDRKMWTLPQSLGLPPSKPKMKKTRCNNCKLWGHNKQLCPDPQKVIVCTACGQRGHNYSDNRRPVCSMTMCLVCGKSQDRFSTGCKVCTFTKTPPVCALCGLESHVEAMCPDNWRRFHSTTTVAYITNDELVEEAVYNNGEVTQAEYREQMDTFCANCGRKGHLFHMCSQKPHRNGLLSHYKPQTPFIFKELSNPTESTTSKLNVDDGIGGSSDIVLESMSHVTVAMSKWKANCLIPSKIQLSFLFALLIVIIIIIIIVPTNVENVY